MSGRGRALAGSDLRARSDGSAAAVGGGMPVFPTYAPPSAGAAQPADPGSPKGATGAAEPRLIYNDNDLSMVGRAPGGGPS